MKGGCLPQESCMSGMLEQQYRSTPDRKSFHLYGLEKMEHYVMHRLEFAEECLLDPSLRRFLMNRKEGLGVALRTSYVIPSRYEIQETVLILFSP